MSNASGESSMTWLYAPKSAGELGPDEETLRLDLLTKALGGEFLPMHEQALLDTLTERHDKQLTAEGAEESDGTKI